MTQFEYDPSAVKTMPGHASGLLELIDVLRGNMLLIGQQRVACLSSFIEGFLFGCPEEESEKGRRIMAKFNRGVRQRFRTRTSHGWARIVEFHSHGDVDSLDLFWRLWDEFEKNRFEYLEKSDEE